MCILKRNEMNTYNFHKEKGTTRVLNLSTNVLTVVLFIIYSIIKRIQVEDIIIYMLLLLFFINFLLSAYLLYRNNKYKDENYRKNNIWIIVRVVANLGFFILTYFLLL